jgi:hypothetical protein
VIWSGVTVCSSIVLAVWHTFLKFEALKTAIIVGSGLPQLTQQVQIFKKKLPFLSAAGCHTSMDGQHCPLRTYHGIFFKARETL